jgi:hypothetical protein
MAIKIRFWLRQGRLSTHATQAEGFNNRSEQHAGFAKPQ